MYVCIFMYLCMYIPYDICPLLLLVKIYCFIFKENTKTIAFRLLDRVLAPELIPGTVESYVRPYAAKHNLLADDLLLAYVNVRSKPCT